MAGLVSSSLYCLYSVYSNSSSQAGSQQFSCTAHCIQCAVHLNWFIHFSSRQIQFTKARNLSIFRHLPTDLNCGMLPGLLSSGKRGLEKGDPEYFYVCELPHLNLTYFHPRLCTCPRILSCPRSSLRCSPRKFHGHCPNVDGTLSS